MNPIHLLTNRPFPLVSADLFEIDREVTPGNWQSYRIPASDIVAIVGSGWGLNGNFLSGGEMFGSVNYAPVQFYTDSVGRGQIAEDGQWNIGGFTNYGAQLSVDNYTGYAIQKWLVSGFERAVVDASGNFGIGETSPSAKLDLKSVSSNPANFVVRVQANAGAIPNGFAVSETGQALICTAGGDSFASVDSGALGYIKNQSNLGYQFKDVGGGSTYYWWFRSGTTDVLTLTATGVGDVMNIGISQTGFYTALSTARFHVKNSSVQDSFRIESSGGGNPYSMLVKGNGETVLGDPASHGAQLTVYNSSNAANVIQNWYSNAGTLMLAIDDGGNFVFNTGAGNQLGTAPAQLIGKWGAAPIAQPTTAVAPAVFVAGGGAAITDTDTFDGYTLKQIVRALRLSGDLA